MNGLKKNVAHIHNEVLAIKNNEIMPICRNMDGPRDHHTKWSISKTNAIWYHLCVESKKTIQMNLFTKQKHSQTQKINLWFAFKQTKGKGK